jgi:hypothetical protein
VEDFFRHMAPELWMALFLVRLSSSGGGIPDVVAHIRTMAVAIGDS